MALTKVLSTLLDLRANTNQADNNTAAGVEALTNTDAPPISGQLTQKNTAYGYYALNANDQGFGSTAIGFEALKLANTDGVSASTAVGANALANTTTGGGNTAIGHDACFKNTTGNLNVAIGKGALYSNDTGSFNIAIGLDALGTGLYPVAGKAGDNNVAIGFNAITIAQAADNNVAIGHQSGANLSTAETCVMIGVDAMQGNATTPTTNRSINSVAVGYRALYQVANLANNNVSVGAFSSYFNATGDENTVVGTSAHYGEAGLAPYENVAMGSTAMYSITSGGRNVAIGKGALYEARNGTGHVAVGFAAMPVSSNGSNYNTALGYGSATDLSGGSNNTCIGNNAGNLTSPFNIVAQSNRVVVGDSSVTNAYIQVAWTVVSDERDKTDIEDVSYGLDFISKLRTVKFKRDNRNRYDGGVSDGSKKDDNFTYGFLAQNVIQAEKDCGATDDSLLVINNEDPENLKIIETSVIPALVKAIQELKAEIEFLKAK